MNGDFEEGATVPAVSSADLQKAFEIAMQNPLKFVGVDYMAQNCSPGADANAIGRRAMMLKLVLHVFEDAFTAFRGTDGRLDAAVFDVAATAPLTRWTHRTGFPFDMRADEFFGQIAAAKK